MKLRIARKMDQKPPHYPGYRRDKRVWWKVYTCEQLARAERRLNRSWRSATTVDDNGMRSVTPDFFRMYRVSSRRIRRGAILKMVRAGTWTGSR